MKPHSLQIWILGAALSTPFLANADDTCQACPAASSELVGEERQDTDTASKAPDGRSSAIEASVVGGGGLSWVLDTSRYPPRWSCGNWSSEIGWMHIVSDLMTWVAYIAIPVMLIYFARKCDKFPFNRLIWLFGAFILFCGTTHLMEAVIFWWPAYGLAGLIKVATAVVSVLTAFALSYAIPEALKFKSPNALEAEVLLRTRELRLAREQATRVIEASPVGMIMVNERGVIVLTNRAAEKLFGYTPDDLRGNLVEILVPEEFRPEHPQLRRDFMSNPLIRKMRRGRELFGVHKAGHKIPIEIELNPVDTDAGGCVLCSVLDLRERRQAEATLRQHAKRLAQANEDLERFAYAASHDLKSPLRAIDNLSVWIAKDIGIEIPEKSRRHLEQMRSRIGRMENLLDGLLSYSRAGRNNDDFEPIDCHMLVREIISTLDIPEHFQVNLKGNKLTIHGRRAALRQVLMNLISNAIKHHDRPNGTVTVSIFDRETDVQFIVEDDGPGIPERFQDRAFEAFQTLHSRDKVEGSGLGLAIVKRVIEVEGGTLVLTSSEGSGARFRITWPHQSQLHQEQFVQNHQGVSQ